MSMARRSLIAGAAAFLTVASISVKAMNLTERPLSSEEGHELEGYSQSGRRMLRLPNAATPAEIVSAVDGFVDDWPRRDAAKVAKQLARSDEIIDLSWSLGALWGAQVVHEFNWYWTVVAAGESERYGVVSADRALAIFPSYFVRECLYDAD